MAVQQQTINYFAADAVETARLVWRLSWRRTVAAWCYVPVGVVLFLCACFGVNSLIGLSSVSFPASVACMLVLFLSLIACDFIIGEKRVRTLVGLLQIPAGFALRYINIFFVPSFVMLPLSPSISGVEVAKIIAVFVMSASLAYLSVLGYITMMIVTAYMVRGLQLIFGSSKRAIIQRAEEMGDESDDIPLSEINPPTQENGVTPDESPTASGLQTPIEPETSIASPPKAQYSVSSRVLGTRASSPVDESSPPSVMAAPIQQTPPPLTRPQRWATFINLHLDSMTWFILFIFIGIPIYYGVGYAMPIHLSFTIVAFLAVSSIPPRYKQILHPVPVTAAICIPGVIVLGYIGGYTWRESLNSYRPNSTYLKLWTHPSAYPAPGAGDMLVSILDASIVAFALPMYQYRKELKQHFFTIIIPNVSVSVASLFGYPVVCYAIGISATRSLSFTSRSLTLALATPAVTNLGGDMNELAPLTIMSGIMGVLIGQQMLAWMRIPEDDYVTRGITLGGNSSAIATALLLVTDPRAAALSCLSMSLFGAITIALTSIPSVVTAVRSLVGL